MKKGFTTFLSALKANTPPCKKGHPSLRFLSLFLILFLAVGNVWAEDVTWEGPYGNFVSKKLSDNKTEVTITKSTSNSSKTISCIKSSSQSYLSINGNGKYLKFIAPTGYTITNIQMVWMSGAAEQALPILFGEEISAIGTVESKDNAVTITNGGFTLTSAIATQGGNNCDSPDNIELPTGTKEVMIGRSGAYNNTDYATIGNVAATVKFRLAGSSGYFNTGVGAGSTPFIGRVVLTVVPEGYSITYHCNGATSGCPSDVASGATALPSTLATPEKTGFIFDKWYTDEGLTTSATAGAPLNANANLYAGWISASLTESAITYADTKGADVTALPTTYYEGIGVASFEPIADVTDYHFVGWKPVSISTEATGNQTITAQWVSAYNIEFNAGTGTGEVPATFQKWDGATFELPAQGALVAPAGKEFAGWSDGTTTYAAGDTYTMGAAAVTFTAQWKAAPTVIFDWTAANSSNIEADNTDLSNATYGTLTVGTSVAGRLLGTNTMAKSSSGYKLGNNDVCIEIQGTSAFEEGDIVVITGKNGGDGERSFAIAPESATAANDETVINTNTIATATDNSEYEVVITATQAGTKMRVFRLASKTMYVKSIKVIRPAQKEILSTDITLSAVTVNTEAISADNLATLKTDPYKLDLTSEYAEAPTVAFTKQTVITYEDATTKTTTEEINDVAKKVDGKWQAQAEINAITYTVTAVIPATYTVIYKDGTETLDEEIVKVSEHPTAAGVATKTFYDLSWKLDEEAVELSNVNGTADQEIILTAVWTPKYAATIDFTIYVQEERLTKSLADVLKDDNHNYVCGGTFNNSEWGVTSENAAYQGYKFKDNGVYIEFLLQSGKRATFLFGSYGSTGTIKVGTAEATECTPPSDSKYVVNATSEDVLVRFTTGGTGTVTLKSITIGDIPTISDDATLKDLKVNGTTIDGFNSATTIYYLTVPYGTEVANMPKITEATANHPSAEAVIYPTEAPEWKDEYGCYLQQVVVTAENGTTKGYYHVRTTVDAKEGVTIIKATHDGTETGATVTGYIGGTVDKKTQGGGKLGSNGHYFGIKLAKGTFLAGDVVTIYASSVSNKVQIFSDKGETMINEGVFNGNYYTYILTEATEWIYLYRTSEGGSNMNPTLGYIEVQRDMDPFIESFEVAGAPGVVDEESKTITVEVSASTDVTALTPTIVAWANGGATVTPTGAQDFTTPVTYSVASAYAEDGTTEYTVTVTKAAAIKEVNITGGTDVKEDETITLSATVIDTNDAEASNQNVTWASDDETTAIVDANGVVTGVKVGTVKITATSVADNTKSASVTITVTENPCRTWNAPAESFSGDITKGKLSIKNSGCSIGDVTPFSGASKVYAYKIDGSSDYVELSFTDKSQFETLTLGVSSGSNGSTPTFVVVASKSAVFDEKTIVEIFTYNANAKDAEQSLVDVSIPEGTRNVRIYRKYNDIGDGSSVSVYYVNACKKDFVPLTSVSLADANLALGKTLAQKVVVNPANADIQTTTWSIESATATGVTIDAATGVLTAAADATEGTVSVKVVATDVLSNVVETTATISIVDKFEVVKPVTATQVWNWAPVAVGEGETIADPDTVLANYISGDEWEMLAGNVGGRPYRNTNYKAYQGTSLYFKAAVPGLLIMYAGSTGNDKDVFVNGTKVGTVKSNKAYMDTIAVQAGDVYITSEAMRIYWMKFDTDFASYEITDNLFNGYTRDVRQGYYGTICLPNGGVMVGASIFEIAYKDASKIYFDEILNGKMVAGIPYIFLPNEGADKLAVFYTDEANESAGSKNGLVGYYDNTDDMFNVPIGNYILLNNQYCKVVGTKAYIMQNYSYIVLGDVPGSAPAPAPGVHRVSMGMAGQNTATGVDQVQGDEVPTKMIINGQLFILRGEKMYDAQGKLVK